MAEPPPYSTAVDLPRMPTFSSSEAKQSILTHPITWLFIILNIWMICYCSGSFEEGLKYSMPHEKTLCPQMFPSFPRDDQLFFGWIVFYYGQLCAVVYLLTTESYHIKPFNYLCGRTDSSNRRVLEKRVFGKLCLFGYYAGMVFTIIPFSSLGFQLHSCAMQFAFANLADCMSFALLFAVFFISILFMFDEILEPGHDTRCHPETSETEVPRHFGEVLPI